MTRHPELSIPNSLFYIRMSRKHFYLLTYLPSMATLGERPPLEARALCEQLDDAPRARTLVETILLSDDLLQRDALLSGETEDVTPAVLSEEQLRGDLPLPDELIPPVDATPKIPGDAVWSMYFLDADRVAKAEGSAFLKAWVGFEVALRNELVETRARALEIEPTDYLVAPELGRTDQDLGPVLNEWTAASNPLAAQRVLDRARWVWLDENGPYFTFGDDELAVYAARLLLVERWHRLTEEEVASS